MGHIFVCNALSFSCKKIHWPLFSLLFFFRFRHKGDKMGHIPRSTGVPMYNSISFHRPAIFGEGGGEK